MQGLDVPFPDTEFQILKNINQFNLIYPLDHPLSTVITIDMMVKVVSFEDEQFAEFLANELSANEMRPVNSRLLEISYIRETAVRNIANFEWDLNYGPDNVRDYLRIAKASPDDYVKVVSLKTPEYSLKSFNRRYGNSAKS